MEITEKIVSITSAHFFHDFKASINFHPIWPENRCFCFRTTIFRKNQLMIHDLGSKFDVELNKTDPMTLQSLYQKLFKISRFLTP